MGKNNKFKNKCRTCLDCSKGLQLLAKMVSENKEESKSYGELLKELTNIDITDETLGELPHTICACCIRKLISAYTFVQQVHEVNDKLWSILTEKSIDNKSTNCLQEAETEIKDCLRIKMEDDVLKIDAELKKEEPEDANCELSSTASELWTTKNEKKETVPLKDIIESNTMSDGEDDNNVYDTFDVDFKKPEDMSESESSNDSDWAEETKRKDSNIKSKRPVESKRVKEKDTDDDIPRTCEQCEKVFPNAGQLKHHQRMSHVPEELKVQCPFCEVKFGRRSNMYAHMRRHHKDKPIEEHIIQQRKLPEHFTDEEFIRNIMNKKSQIKSSIKSIPRRCDECGNIYKNNKALYSHQRHVHISEDNYSVCPHCGKKYKRKTDLTIHIKKSHISKNPIEIKKQPAKVREKRFMCSKCSYVCTTINILNVHISRHHTGEKPYKCDICFKSFIIPYDLKIHRYLHTGERPYQCPICSKGFRDSAHMNKHKSTHSGERPYKCKECGKSYAQPYTLSVHKRTHLREKNLNCIVCGTVFENSSLLNMHRINENHHDT